MKDRDETKQKIINAVGEIFKTEGKNGLYIARIARQAGVDRSLIYQYFGKDVKRLIEDYIVQKDYWLKFFDTVKKQIDNTYHESGKELIIDIFKKQWQIFSTDTEMQHLILWELSGESELMRSIHNTRELMSEPILGMTDAEFSDSVVKFRPIAVLLLGGIYYANIHTVYNGNIMCGIDLKSKEGQKDIMRAIQQIIEWAYEHNKKEVT